MGDLQLGALESLVLLLGVASVAAILARRVAVPYSVALVVIGVAAAVVAPQLEPVVTPELVLGWLLPGLIFEAALRMDLEAVRRAWPGIVLLAVPGVVISAAIFALILHLGTGLALDLAFVVGAALAATDPSAVIATFKSVRVPRRLSTLIESESLFNDGMAIVVFVMAISALHHGFDPGATVVSFIAIVVVSSLIGLAAGFIGSRLIAAVDDRFIELAVSVTVAYGAYLLADVLHESGVLATLAAGAVIGTYGRRVGMSERTRDALDTVWGFVAFILTTFAFLLVGLAISVGDIVDAARWIAVAVLGMWLGRALVTYVLLGSASRLRAIRGRHRPLPLAWLHVMFWAGLRGAVAVALALSLPSDVPQRDLLQTIIFGVVLVSLVVQGGTVGWVVERALGSSDEER